MIHEGACNFYNKLLKIELLFINLRHISVIIVYKLKITVY